MSSLFEIAEKAVRIALGKGAHEAEAYVERNRIFEFLLERNDFKTFRVKWHHGVGVRAVYDKRVGFAYASSLSISDIERTCESAVENAKLSPRLKDWISLPYPTSLPSVSGTYCDEIANITEIQLTDLSKRAYDAIFETDKRAKCDDGKISTISEETVIANSNGILVGEEGTAISGYMVCIASEAGKTSSFATSNQNSRILKNFNPEELGREAALLAVRSLNPRKVESFTGDIVLEWMPAANIVMSVIGYSVNADMVQRKSSFWSDKLGERVASSDINVIDSGVIEGGMATSKFDGEGVGRKETPLISSGILKNYIYDFYTASKESKNSTGNSGRPSYASTPMVSPSNLIINEGSKNIDDLISDVDRGLLVGRFSGNIEPASGIFSGTVKQSVYIEKGELKFAVEETMISGNVFKFLMDNVILGRPRRIVGNIQVAPILLKNVNIISKT